MTSIAFLGLGAMGSRMAARLLDAGHDLTVFNRTRERAQPLARAWARVADTPAEAARGAEVVITMLTDPAALRAVLDGPDGVAAGLEPGATVIDMSTVGPGEIARLAGALPDGTGVLDAPVLKSIAEAEAGTLEVFVGGPDELVARLTPLLRTLGTPVHVGPLGAGAAAKLVANSTLFGVLGVLGEAVALADALGLSRASAMAVLARTPLAEQSLRREPVLATDEVPATRFKLSLARKDADLVLEAAAGSGLELRLAAAARAWLADAEAAGLADADYSLVLRSITNARAR